MGGSEGCQGAGGRKKWGVGVALHVAGQCTEVLLGYNAAPVGVTAAVCHTVDAAHGTGGHGGASRKWQRQGITKVGVDPRGTASRKRGRILTQWDAIAGLGSISKALKNAGCHTLVLDNATAISKV